MKLSCGGRPTCQRTVDDNAENTPPHRSASRASRPATSTDGNKRLLRPNTPPGLRERTGNRRRSRASFEPTSPANPRNSSRSAHDKQRGSGTVETVIAMGLLALIVLGMVQYAADVHGQQAAQAAASIALATAREQNGTAGAGQAAAQAELAQLTTALHDPNVSVSRSATEVDVTITGTVTGLLGVTEHVHVSTSGPVDRFEPNTSGS